MRFLKTKPALVILVFMFFTLVACNLTSLVGKPSENDNQAVKEIVNATLTAIALEAIPDQPEKPTATLQATEAITEAPQSLQGTISGSLGFPSEYIPPLRVVAFDTNSQDYFYVDTLRNQTDYEISDLPPGTYHVVAFVREEGADFAGGYSHFVTCGQTVDCTDHSLIDVQVVGGEVTADVDPVDFYAQPGEADWPADPTQ